MKRKPMPSSQIINCSMELWCEKHNLKPMILECPTKNCKGFLRTIIPIKLPNNKGAGLKVEKCKKCKKNSNLSVYKLFDKKLNSAFINLASAIDKMADRKTDKLIKKIVH